MCFNLGLNRVMPKDVKIYLPHLSLSLCVCVCVSLNICPYFLLLISAPLIF